MTGDRVRTYTRESGGGLAGTGETFALAADMVLKAIGQVFVPDAFGGAARALELEGGRIKVDAERRTSLPGVWAGGDCVAGGQDLTVVGGRGRQARRRVDRPQRWQAQLTPRRLATGGERHG